MPATSAVTANIVTLILIIPLPRNLRRMRQSDAESSRAKEGRRRAWSGVPPLASECGPTGNSTKKVTAREIKQKLVCARDLAPAQCVKGRARETSAGWGFGDERVAGEI